MAQAGVFVWVRIGLLWPLNRCFENEDAVSTIFQRQEKAVYERFKTRFSISMYYLQEKDNIYGEYILKYDGSP